jgi:hypothetical protein
VSVSGAGARRKGLDWEREVVRRFAEVFGADQVRRGFQFRDGSEIPDVVAPIFAIECKRGKRTDPKGALKQAMRGADGKGLWALAVSKDDNEPAIVTMHLDDFLELVREWWRTKGA